jgi:hypothetical protein
MIHRDTPLDAVRMLGFKSSSDVTVMNRTNFLSLIDARAFLWLLVILTAALLAGLPACDEALPPRVEPDKVIAYGLSLSSGSINVERGAVTSGGTFTLNATNVYDDVLSDRALLVGYLTVHLKESPDSLRNLVYTSSDMLIPSMLIGGVLTIDPNQTLSLTQPWDFLTDHGTQLWQPLPFLRGVTDKGRVFYRSGPGTLQVSGSLQLYDRVQAVKIPLQEFPVVFTLWDTSPPIPTNSAP